MGGLCRLGVRVVVIALAAGLLTGFGEPKQKTSLEREVGKQLSSKGRPYRQYRTVRDDSRTLSLDAPTKWNQVRGTSQFVAPETGERYGSGMLVSPELEKFRNSLVALGFRFTATNRIPDSVDELLNANAAKYDDVCTRHDVRGYDDGRYEGLYEYFTRCGGTKTAAVVVSATSPADGVFIIVAAQVRTRADLAAIDRAIASSKLT